MFETKFFPKQSIWGSIGRVFFRFLRQGTNQLSDDISVVLVMYFDTGIFSYKTIDNSDNSPQNFGNTSFYHHIHREKHKSVFDIPQHFCESKSCFTEGGSLYNLKQ